MPCPSCGAPNPAGHRFCGQCGAALAARCPACGVEASPGERFCGSCGAPLSPRGAEAPAGTAAPQTERRVVSILFADLVGFTTLSEQRDTEDVRALLSRYFDTARTVVERYGGVVEKFIGDAVMALWGAPTAREDDAERAVRAALDLCDAVAAFGAEVNAPDLRLRAGVATGEAAVTVGAQGQGMVAGDTVNTASRIQSAAPPGGVLVDEATWRATESAIGYDEVEEHTLKGKAEAVRLRRAARVTGRRGGSLRGTTLEAPFVGRDPELRLVKALFEATAEDARARLVAVSGAAGIGKSRLAWEFEKYLDGIAATVRWHRGRCLPYGEGVAYWALTEMVRSRAGITELEDARSARDKLHATIESIAVDAEESRWLEARLGQLLDVEAAPTTERTDLFAAWRLFFERLAATSPVVMVFEEMQWADSGLVEFVAYLMEWSRHHPIFVMTLARPEFSDRHPSFAANLRSVHALYLEPLGDDAMDELLCGLAPGLPADVRRRIAARAEGVPLYAVETVRMLLDRGRLQRDGDTVRVCGAVDDVEVPESLHALIAARLDNLGERERGVVRDASVLGQSFPAERLALLSGVPEAEIRPLLDSLVRREILAVDDDPRSPGRGHYAFSQALMQRVAYETLSRRDRKSRHLAAARQLEEAAGDGDDVVEVVAAHYLEAIAAAPQDEDADDLRRSAREMLMRAGDRAMSVAAAENAHRYFVRAAELVDADGDRAEILLRAGNAAAAAGNVEEGRRLLEEAAAGTTAPSVRASATARLGELDFNQGSADAGVRRLQEAWAVLGEEGRDDERATVGAQLARFGFLAGDNEMAMRVADSTLEIAERQPPGATLVSVLNTKGMLLVQRGRIEEGTALVRHALHLAEEADLSGEQARAHTNLGVLSDLSGDARDELRHGLAALALERRAGNRAKVVFMLSNVCGVLQALGEWDECLRFLDEAPEVPAAVMQLAAAGLGWSRGEILLQRGDLDAARAVFDRVAAVEGSDPQLNGIRAMALARFAQLTGDLQTARRHAAVVLQQPEFTGRYLGGTAAVILAAAATQPGDIEETRTALQAMEQQAGREHDKVIAPFLDVARAMLAAAEGDTAAPDSLYRRATDTLRRLELRPMLAEILLHHAGWLVSVGRHADAEPLLAEAVGIAEPLGATLWTNRAASIRAGMTPPQRLPA